MPRQELAHAAILALTGTSFKSNLPPSCEQHGRKERPARRATGEQNFTVERDVFGLDEIEVIART